MRYLPTEFDLNNRVPENLDDLVNRVNMELHHVAPGARLQASNYVGKNSDYYAMFEGLPVDRIVELQFKSETRVHDADLKAGRTERSSSNFMIIGVYGDAVYHVHCNTLWAKQEGDAWVNDNLNIAELDTSVTEVFATQKFRDLVRNAIPMYGVGR